MCYVRVHVVRQRERKKEKHNDTLLFHNDNFVMFKEKNILESNSYTNRLNALDFNLSRLKYLEQRTMSK